MTRIHMVYLTKWEGFVTFTSTDGVENGDSDFCYTWEELVDHYQNHPAMDELASH